MGAAHAAERHVVAVPPDTALSVRPVGAQRALRALDGHHVTAGLLPGMTWPDREGQVRALAFSRSGHVLLRGEVAIAGPLGAAGGALTQPFSARLQGAIRLFIPHDTLDARRRPNVAPVARFLLRAGTCTGFSP